MASSAIASVTSAGAINEETRFTTGSKTASTTGYVVVSPFEFLATITLNSFSISTANSSKLGLENLFFTPSSIFYKK
mgnify:CR=1 FL=1